MAASIGIKTPKAEICRTREECKRGIEKIGFPLLVKPVDLTGGKGIKTCVDINETLDAFDEAMKITREDYIILEEFIQGKNHGITALIKNGKVVFHIVDNEQYGMNDYLVLGANSPSDIPQYVEFILIRDIEKIAEHCNLVDGLFHAQFILDKDNYPIMIDPCRRAPGDLYTLLAKYVTGVDYPAEIVKAECGEPIKDFYETEYNFVARECIMASKKGTIKEVHIEDEIRQYLVHTFLRPSQRGIKIEDPMTYKAGILIMKFDTYEEMESILNRFQKLVWIELEEE